MSFFCSLLPAPCSLKIIVFSGLDGSGKSTQLNLLKTRLEQEGKRVAVFHAIEFSLANRIARYFKGRKSFEPGKEKAVTRASFFSLLLRKVFLFIDILRFWFFKKRLERDGVDFLLSDRYFHDTVLNIFFLSFPSGGGATERRGGFLSTLESLIPRPDLAFYLRVTPEEILKRDRVPEQGLEYLRRKFELLEQKKSDWHLIEVDASLTEEQIFQHIEEIIHSGDTSPSL